MSNAQYADVAATELRAIIAVIDQEIVRLPPMPALRAASAELVEAPALDPAPRTPSVTQEGS
jgi:hypothetical protein